MKKQYSIWLCFEYWPPLVYIRPRPDKSFAFICERDRPDASIFCKLFPPICFSVLHLCVMPRRKKSLRRAPFERWDNEKSEKVSFVVSVVARVVFVRRPFSLCRCSLSPLPLFVVVVRLCSSSSSSPPSSLLSFVRRCLCRLCRRCFSSESSYNLHFRLFINNESWSNFASFFTTILYTELSVATN